MAEHTEDQAESVAVREFSGACAPVLDPEGPGGRRGLGNQQRSSRIQKLELALAGFTDCIHSGRIQVIGGSEMNCLRILNPEGRRVGIRRLKNALTFCIIAATGLKPSDELPELAQQNKILVLRTFAEQP